MAFQIFCMFHGLPALKSEGHEIAMNICKYLLSRLQISQSGPARMDLQSMRKMGTDFFSSLTLLGQNVSYFWITNHSHRSQSQITAILPLPGFQQVRPFTQAIAFFSFLRNHKYKIWQMIYNGLIAYQKIKVERKSYNHLR